MMNDPADLFKRLTNARAQEEIARNRQELLSLIEEIGIARFAGRINSGIIDHEIGYSVVAEHANPPSLLQRLLNYFRG